MLQSKLLTLLRTFTKEELKSFDAFLLSPYFNQSEKLVKFFRLIEPHQPLFDSEKLQKEILYKALHRRSKYNDSTMRELISDLFKLAKVFVAQEELRGDSLENSALRFRWLYIRNVEKLIVPELETWNSLLDGHLQHDDSYYQHRWLNEHYKFHIRHDEIKEVTHKLFKKIDILSHVHSLNRNYLVNCLSAYHYLLALKRMSDFSLDEESLRQVEALARPYLNKGDTVIDILFNAFQLMRTDDEKYFYELKATVLENDRFVPESVVTEAAVAIKNYCGIQIGEGIEKFRLEIVQIYRFEVENNYFLYQGKMSYGFYLNIAAIVSETSELDWSEYFVENYKDYLPEEYREDAYYYAKAHILFARKKYEPALRLALSCKIPFPVAKIVIRNLVARIQYELGMLDEMQTELDTHRHHLKDEKLTPDYRQKLQPFITALRQLGELKGNYNQEKLMLLQQNVNTQKAFASKLWVQRKIAELHEMAGRGKKVKRHI